MIAPEGAGFNEEAIGYENIVRRGLVIGARGTEIDAGRAEMAEFTELGDKLDLRCAPIPAA